MKIPSDYRKMIYILIFGIIIAGAVVFFSTNIELDNSATPDVFLTEDEYEESLNEEPNLLLALVILVGLSFIVTVIMNKRG